MKAILRYELLWPIVYIFFGLFSSPVDAANFKICAANGQRIHWENSNQDLKYRSLDFSSPSPELSAVQAAVNSLNNPESHINISIALTSGGGNSINDDLNSINMNSGGWFQHGTPGNIAITHTQRQSVADPENCHLFDENEIFLDPDFNWTTNTQIDPTSSLTLRNMYLRVFHELGHFFGLSNGTIGHMNFEPTVMNEFFPHGGVIGNSKKVRFLPDDLSGFRTLYGDSGLPFDVMSSSYELDGANSGKAVLIEPVNKVTAQGLRVLTNYTVGNRGKTATFATVKFYFSTNDIIDPMFDTASETELLVPLNGEEIKTDSVAVKVPANISSPFDYYLGYDAQVAVIPFTDSDPLNNAVPLYRDKIHILPSSTPLPAPTCSFEFVGCFLNRPNWFINVNPNPNFPLPIIDYVWEKSTNNGAIWDPADVPTECNFWTGEHSFQHITGSGYPELLRVHALSELGSGAHCYLYLYYNCGGGGGQMQ